MCRGLKHNRVLCDILLRHIVSTYKSPIDSTDKNAQQLLVKTATNCLFVRLLVAQNDKTKKRNYDSGCMKCLRKSAVDRKAIFNHT